MHLTAAAHATDKSSLLNSSHSLHSSSATQSTNAEQNSSPCPKKQYFIYINYMYNCVFVFENARSYVRVMAQTSVAVQCAIFLTDLTL